ncbi:hypothetical protein HID58_042992 [Brassica napus]|uniref:BEACH domain-containing protein B n=1 Tax=Brassica napus TaxID=3708 RepID=A0ABQ8BF74_BRANA|nr:hypothetical protein HID58_042992 [Brassica napus]
MESPASSDATASHSPSVSVLLDALEQSVSTPSIANGLSQRLLRSLQLSNENKLSFKALNGPCRVLRLACTQARESRKSLCVDPLLESSDSGVLVDSPHKKSHSEDCWFECVETCIGIFSEFFSSTDDAKVYVLRSSVCVDCLFELFWEKAVRNNVMKHIIDLMKITPLCEEDKTAKLQVCSKYLETFTQVKERENDFVDLSVDLLAGMRDLIKTDSRYYQALFRDGECFLHIVSLLNGNFDEANGEKLVLNVLQTLTSLLANNDASKFAFKALAGKGYQTLQSLLLDFFQWQPTQRLLDALLDMLVDGKFDDKGSALIKNEDVIILYLNVLQKSSESLQCYGLNLFQQLLRDSISNRASCVRAGMLNLLLDWFSLEDAESVILKITQLTRTIGGHSISGKDIRKIFALLRSERVGNQQKYRSLLLACLLSMLNEKGPTGFFDMNGVDSGIVIKTPVQWPVNKGFSFCCWLRVESFRGDGKMGIFSFMPKNGKGCFAAVGNDGLSYVSLNLKRQCVNVHTNLVSKKWHFICVSHSIGRAFWGGSLLRCYVDGELVSSERCSYPKVTDVLTSCFIGTSITLPHIQDNEGLESIRDVFPFFGQIGPIYLFNDALSSDQVQAIYSLGPSYMYAFLENEMTGPFSDNPFPSAILDGKDGLAPKVSFGLNAQASDGRRLFNVSRVSDHLQDRLVFEADIMVGTQLCSRRLLQQIIYCVGGISVFFPLITQTDRCESEALQEEASSMPAPEERMTAEVIELIASVLDENPGNQQQMHLLSGFPILGFLLQSIQPKQLNLETLSSLKHLFNVISSSGTCWFAEQLVEDAISSIFLNPHIWIRATYNVQRELYMFLIQQLDNDPRLLGSLCRLPRVIDIVWNFYWESERYRSAKGSKTLLQPARTIAERPIFALSFIPTFHPYFRQNITSGDVKALIAFFETCQDVACIEDVLHMVIRAISQTSILASFLEQVNLIGGCHIFVNLLQRDYEPIRLLSLQFLGRLLYDVPSEKKGPRFFTLPVGRTKFLSQGHKKIGGRTQPIFVAMSDRLFQYPQTDNLRATLFDVLLGGASPKQEFGWSAWISASVTLDVIKDYRSELLNYDDLALNEQHFVRGLFCVVLCHYILSVKGGWQQLEETVNFILLHCEHNDAPYRSFLRDLYEDLIQRLVELSSEDNIFLSHPCRDNVLYLLRLVDEMLVREFGSRLLFPANSADFSEDLLQLANREDHSLGLDENFQRLLTEETSRGPMKMSPKSLATGPSIGQRARGLVESLNVPAAEMAAVVVSGGIGNALSGKINKNVDKAMLLRSEKCPRIVFRLVTLYLCMSSLEKATRCVQQVTSLLPSFLSADDEQSKSRLHLFIGCLLYVRSQYGKLDDGARFHVISHLIRETVSCGKSILATSGMSKDDSSESGGIFKEVGSIQNLIHKDRVLAAVTDETTYMKTLLSDRTRQVKALGERNNEASSLESNSKKPFDDELQSGIRRITDEAGSESCENDNSQSEQNLLDTSAEIQFSELVRSSSDLKDVVQEKVDASSLEVETSEVLTSVPCVLITPKRKLAGCLAVMKNVLHFSGEFLVEGTGGSSVFKNFSTSKGGDVTKPDSKQILVKWSSPYERETSLDLESEKNNQKSLKKFKRHRRWKIGKVKSVHWTRYLLQYTAVEIFFQESSVARDRTAVISFVDRRVAMEMAEVARDRWRRREITNFEYLMILNTLAGRSYNDLTQYPVFPWVVADYSSETLDFSKASTFRDLSKPVGALDSRRFEVFEDRYHSFSDPDIPSFYYGSHYSSMGSVLYYLLRLEPFTSLHRSLQGGKFDHADRLFQSIEGTYRNCLSNTSDVKELIPEFFYMPEFLVNSNSYHLGVKQDGEPLGDICLPPWAKGSPEMFIARNREALESEYVSSHLHEWIDLIFGHKQRGKPAVEAANIFYYLTYEGAVDVENMEDELQISAVEDQIANFGQTPIQIFRKKHPRRGPPIPIAHPLYFAPASINLTSILPATTNPPSSVLYVGVLDSNIVLVNQGLTLSVKIWLTTQLHSGGNFTFSSSQDPYFGVGSDVLSPRNIGSPLADNVELGSQCFATMQTPQENFLVSCGNWENSFHVISLADGRVVQSIRHHKDVVSCVAVTADSSILATGSYDTTVMVWDILRMKTPEKRVKNMHAEALRRDIVLADAPSHILCGHDDIITCLYVSTDLDIVISGSKDGTCVFHTLREGRYIRSLKHPSGSAVSKLAASHHGRIVLYGDDDLSLHLYSINGKHLASSESNGRINCLELSKCGEFLVTAGDQGQIVVRSMNTLEVVRRYSGAGKIISSLTVTQEECFLAGTKDGALLVYSIENPQHRKPSPVWSIKS